MNEPKFSTLKSRAILGTEGIGVISEYAYAVFIRTSISCCVGYRGPGILVFEFQDTKRGFIACLNFAFFGFFVFLF